MSGDLASGGCIPSGAPGPIHDLTDLSTCWNNILDETPVQPTVAANSFTCAVDVRKSDLLASYWFPFEWSNYFDTSDPLIVGPPCQPSLCDRGVRLTFDWSIDAQLTELSGNIRVSVPWTIHTEIVELYQLTNDYGPAFEEFDHTGVLCATNGTGPACPGGSVSSINDSGTGSVEFAGGAIENQRIVGCEIFAEFDTPTISSSGVTDYRLIGTIVISNLQWELI